jgi:hypothetical protein
MNRIKLFLGLSVFFFGVVGSSAAFAKYDWAVRGHDEAWKQECSVCHMAYMPKWLSAANWRQIMQGLNDHFGVNASLPDRERQEITDFLVTHGASDSDSRYSAATLRITDTEWWSRHGPNAARFWAGGKVGRAANCDTCHKGADFR